MFDLKEPSILPRMASGQVDDHLLSLSWSACGTYLAALPSDGRVAVLAPAAGTRAWLPGHQGGNGSLAWHPQRPILATYGQDGVVRLSEPPFSEVSKEFVTGLRGWAERLVWSPDGSMIAVGAGRSLVVFDAASGGVCQVFTNPESTIGDLAWNPTKNDELAAVCSSGLRLWRLGSDTAIGSFDWGGASLSISWSADGRWLVTGDQTPSVHVYEVVPRTTLHIQGFETKVKSMAWRTGAKWLAIAGGQLITVWPFSGKKGPNGAQPIELRGHEGDVTAMVFAPGSDVLFSAGRDGMLLLWKIHGGETPALISHEPDEISSLAIHPDAKCLACGNVEGEFSIWSLDTRK
ncbi:MAG: WD40 repeat domain-containing protein [Terrimicrobiaceae bacterium]